LCVTKPKVQEINNHHQEEQPFKESASKEVNDKFDQTYAESVAKEIIESTVGEEKYEHTKTVEWTNQMCEKILSKLLELQKPFKYIGGWFYRQVTSLYLAIATSLLFFIAKERSRIPYCDDVLLGCRM